MLIYLLVILLILLLQDHLLRLPKKAIRIKMEVKYLRIVCWILVLLAALRGSSVGTDTIAYIENYNAFLLNACLALYEEKSRFKL